MTEGLDLEPHKQRSPIHSGPAQSLCLGDLPVHSGRLSGCLLPDLLFVLCQAQKSPSISVFSGGRSGSGRGEGGGRGKGLKSKENKKQEVTGAQ